ncbi:MAG: DsbA family protein [Longimicrobiales bacterium]
MRPVLAALLLGIPALPLAAQAIDVDGLGFVSGAADAPVQVVEFSDFSCPFCKDFHQGTYQTLHEGYIATGKVQWIYVTFASGQYPNSFVAGAVVECAGEQGHFEVVRDRLYEHQDDWKHVEPQEAGDFFLGLTEDLELDRAVFMDCVQSERIGERIQRASKLAASVGVKGTPTYVIDGFPAVGALPAEFIGPVLAARLAQLGVGH